MEFQYTSYALPLILGAIVAAVLAYAIWRRRPGPGVVPFIALMLGVIGWTIPYALELSAVDLRVKVIFTSLQYIGITTVPGAWLAFVLEYTGREKWLTRRNIALLFIEPIATVATTLTNEYHYLFRYDISLDTSRVIPMISSTFGPAFWVHAVYSYILLTVGTGLLIQSFIRSPQLYRGQVTWLLIGAFAPWAANAVYIFEVFPSQLLDPTPFAFVVTGMAMGWSIYRYRLMDIVPVARDAVIESMSDVVMVLDAQNRIVDVNPAALRVVGRTSPEIIGQLARDVLSGQQGLVERFRDIETAREEIALGEGEARRYFDLRISPLRNRRGDLTGRLFVLHDISERKQAEGRIQEQNEALVRANRELALARKKAEEVARLKSEFLATMSHELRTPLNAIMGYSQIILEGIAGEVPPKQRENQERIFSNAQTLTNLINDILDLAKIEAGRTEIINRPFTLFEWLTEIVQQTEGLARQKNLDYKVVVDEQMPKVIVGDTARLKQIALNLISNAIKFTDQGYVRVEIQRQPENTWMLVVSDSGIGIPSHAQEYIFDEFRQVDGSPQRKYGGTGLGLSIVRNLALMMGGNVRVKSEVGEGSTFTVRLPLVTEVELVEESP